MKNTYRSTSPYSHSLLLSYWNWDCTSSKWFVVRFSYHVCNSWVDVYYVGNDGFGFSLERPGERKGSWRRSWKPGSCFSLVFCCALVALFLTYIAFCINKDNNVLFVDYKKAPRRWIEHLTLWSSVIRSPDWAILALLDPLLSLIQTTIILIVIRLIMKCRTWKIDDVVDITRNNLNNFNPEPITLPAVSLCARSYNSYSERTAPRGVTGQLLLARRTRLIPTRTITMSPWSTTPSIECSLDLRSLCWNLDWILMRCVQWSVLTLLSTTLVFRELGWLVV